MSVKWAGPSGVMLQLIVKVEITDGSCKTLMVDERQTVREVIDNLFEKTHCDGNVDWCLCETNPELQTGEVIHWKIWGCFFYLHRGSLTCKSIVSWGTVLFTGIIYRYKKCWEDGMSFSQSVALKIMKP